MNPKDEASSIKIKNMIDMAITFTAMTRVFEKRSKQKIAEKIECTVPLLSRVENKNDFERIHSDFCEWFIQNIHTARKGLKNNSIKESHLASYGHAGKFFDVALKSLVYYCNLPNPHSAQRLFPMLHGAVDTKMMDQLKKRYPQEIIKAKSIEAVRKPDYFTLQKLVVMHIEDEFSGMIVPIEYDDILWHRLNRLSHNSLLPALENPVDNEVMIGDLMGTID